MFEEIDGTSDEVTSSVNLRWHLRPRNGTALSAKGPSFRDESWYEKNREGSAAIRRVRLVIELTISPIGPLFAGPTKLA